MSMTTVEFICDENVAAPGTLATPRPVDRPRPAAVDLNTSRLGAQAFDGDSVEPSSAEPPMKHDATA